MPAPRGSQSRNASPHLSHLGRFQIQDKLGAGAFGEVYRAHDPVLEREVALKIPRPGVLDSSKARSRFLREPKAAAQLRHPNIVPVYDAGKDGEHYYIASAFIEGHTLQQAIDQASLDLHRSAEIVRDLALALQYAHAMGVVHRDVKPANIILDVRGEPMLMDFGLARLESTEEKLTQDGVLMGTPAYMAPEQAGRQQSEVGPASDQYALGAILYELLCGQTPFSGPPHVVVFNVLHEEPPAPHTINPQTPKDLETICAKAMAKHVSGRYADCGEMAADLRRWLDGEPIRARRMGPAERIARWARRNPAVAALLATVVVITMVGFLAISSLWVRAEQHRTVAETNAADAQEQRRIAQDRSVSLERQTEELARQRDVLTAQKQTLERQKSELEQKNNEIVDLLAEVRSGKRNLDEAFEEVQKSVAEKEKAYGALSDNRDLLARQRVQDRRQLYARQMLQSFEAFELHNHDLARGLLRDNMPRDGEEDLRSFPWYHLTGRYGLTGKLNVGAEPDHLRHPGGIYELRFSPDGGTLISIGGDMSVKTWDVARASCRYSFAPSRRLSFLATRALPRYQEDRTCESIAVSPDGNLVAMAPLGRGTLSIWNLDMRTVSQLAGAETLQIPRGISRPASSFLSLRVAKNHLGPIAFNRDGQLAAVSAAPGTATPVVGFRRGVPVESLTDALLVGFSLTPKLIDPETGATFWESKTPLSAQAHTTAPLIIPAGNAVFPPANSPPLPGLDACESIRYFQFSPSGRRLGIVFKKISIQPDGSLKHEAPGEQIMIVDTDKGVRRAGDISTTWQPGNRLAFSPDDRLLAILRFPEPSGPYELQVTRPTIDIRELVYGRLLGSFAAELGTSSIRFTPDGQFLVSWRGLSGHPSQADIRDPELGKDVLLWKVETGELENRLAKHPTAVRSIDISQDGRILVSGSEDHTVRIWDMLTGLECGYFKESTSAIRSVAISPDGTVLAAGNARGSIYLYRTKFRLSGEFSEGTQGVGNDFLVLAEVGLHVEKDSATGTVSVLQVHPDTPARRAGFLPYDSIVQIGEKVVKDCDDVRLLTNLGPDGGDLKVVVERDGTQEELLLVLDSFDTNDVESTPEDSDHE